MTSQDEIAKYEKEHLLLKEKIMKKTGKTPEELYEEREKRVRDAVALKEPDRVPFGLFLETQIYGGTPNSAAYYDPIAWKRAMRKVATDFEPDMVEGAFSSSGEVMEIMGVQNQLWPGGNAPANYGHQYKEGEYMKSDEYDMFISDPSGFMITRFLPRIYSTLAPLAKLPHGDMLMRGFDMLTPLLSSPEFVEMAKRIQKAGKLTEEFRKLNGNYTEEMAQLGFPPLMNMALGIGGPAFDTISSSLRGMKGTMIDMYRQPEKLLKACDVIYERQKARAMPANPKLRGNPKKLGMPLWRGDKKFMSYEQFKKFYWPGLKKALQTNIDLGYVPNPIFEAEYGERLEHLLELPKGKMIIAVEYPDAFRAKEILGGHSCILVHPPNTSAVWSLQEVEKCVKELIDKCGKGGGMMLIIRLPDKGTTKGVQAMLESIKEYARY